MDLRNAMEYIAEQAAPHVVEINGDTYTDKQMTRIPQEMRAEPIQMRTLTSLLDYISSNVDELDACRKYMVHVTSPTRVDLVSCLNFDRMRETLAIVEAQIPEFSYDTYMDHERFLIALQAKFLPGDDRELLLKFAGTVESGTVAQYGDDGVTQKATVKSGISSKTDAIVPNPVILAPYRTFLEVEQPESSFIFRMRDSDRGGVSCALFEADGGAWRNEAMSDVAAYIIKQLSGRNLPEGMFTVIY